MENILISFIFMAVCLAVCALLIAKQKREIRRYVDLAVLKECNQRKESIREAMDFMAGFDKENDKRQSDAVQKLSEEIKKAYERLKALEDGLVPDFEEAKAAAKAVNDFNKGISAIMGYDPFEARRKAQEERGDNR